MIQRLIERRLRQAEKELGAPVDEMRYVAKHSLYALRAWGTVRSWADFRRVLTPEAFYIAKLAAYRQEDCGTCVQITLHLARKAGVSEDLLKTVLSGHPERLPDHLQTLYLFAEQQANRVDDEELREKIRQRWGDEGLIDLAFAITGARAFPTFKRVLGYARSCSLVS